LINTLRLKRRAESDPQVPKEEAHQVFDARKQAGKTVELHSYPQRREEGHGFERREDRIDALRRTLGWFEKYPKPR
jgi:dipeptidyl aminopeptidase/acylaminoacyl peptidase